MNKLVTVSMILILLLNQFLVNGQTIQPIERSIGKLQISIDPRMEILSTVQLLSNYPMINRASPYSREILNYFESFSSHEAVLMTDSLLQKHGFSFDAPVGFMLYLSHLPELEQKIEYTHELILRSGGSDNLEQYRKSIKHFAEISNFETFWNSKIPFYNQILDLSVAEIGDRDLVKDLEDYFNETNESYNVVISPSFIGGFAHTLTDADGKKMLYSCNTTTGTKEDIPYLHGNSSLDLVWHEFGHAFVNPLTDKYFDKVGALNKLFEPIRENMANQAYGRWGSCVNEHVIRAINVRLFELHLGSQEAKNLLQQELRSRFIYIEPLVEKLKDFEVQRDNNNVTFTEFYPELLNVLDSLLKIEYWKQFDFSFKGPIKGAVMGERLAIIYPTDDFDTEALKIAQEEASGLFERFVRAMGGVLLADTTALKTDLSGFGIMAYGTVESNLFLKHHASSFPFRIENHTIFADNQYTDKDLKFISCVPNPYNSQKGMSIFTALSNKAIQGINVAFFENDFEFLSVDYVLFLNRETVISRGFYKKDEKWTF
ncbi:MAG: DUF4932 domain-containing protein [Candidatus Azobacteroides sp.]|nr:DUF4932 domain-containing protein [Candidatus Azobacteroides sp.]